jgi:hypothetical protein
LFRDWTTPAFDTAAAGGSGRAEGRTDHTTDTASQPARTLFESVGVEVVDVDPASASTRSTQAAKE